MRATTLTAAIRTPIPTTATRSREALERCLEPISVEQFLDHHWEQRPLVVPRSEPGRFDDLLSAGDVERLVCSHGLRFPGFRLVKAGESPRVADYTVDLPWRPASFSGSPDVTRIAAAFDRGATLVLQALHLHWPALAVFCRELEAQLGHPVQANAYYTPRDSQGLPVHHDTHDVLVLQVSGEKRWLVYEPALELPLRDQRYGPELGAPGETVQDITLRAGDTLYLPRGWLHEALTSSRDSLHLTIGINVHTWLDALRAALEACADDVEFRRSVPAEGALEVDLLERLRARLKPEQIAARMRGKLVRMRRPILPDQLQQVRLASALEAETPLERRATVLADLDAGATLTFEGKQLRFPLHVRDDLEFVCNVAHPFCAADLPGSLDESSRLVLLRRLVREGFLAVTPSPRNDGGVRG